MIAAFPDHLLYYFKWKTSHFNNGIMVWNIAFTAVVFISLIVPSKQAINGCSAPPGVYGGVCR